MRMLASMVAALCLGLLVVRPALAHGGRYTQRPGFGAGVPPTGGTAPPSAGARTGSPGAPVSTARPGGPPSTARSRGAGASELDPWTSWWEYNKEPLLMLRSHLAMPARTGEGSSTAERVSRRSVRDLILPALVVAIKDPDPDVADAAALAIGRSCGPAESDLAYPALLSALGSPHASVREAATLALGLLGDAKAVDVLADLALDTPKARTHLRLANATPQQVRSFAAIGLGLLGDERGVAVLKTLLDRGSASDREVKAAAVVGMGLLDKNDLLVTYLLEKLDDRDLDRVVRAQIPTAIAKFAASGRAAVPALLAFAQRKETDDDLLRSLVIALGKLGTMDQTPVIDWLRAVADRQTDPAARQFAWIAMAEIGARDAEPDLHLDAHRAMATLLLDGASRPGSVTTQPWAALALGLYARVRQDQMPAAARAMRTAFVRTDSPANKAALALGLALVNATDVAPEMMKEMDKGRDQSLRGYLALALGVMRHASAAPVLRRYLHDPGLDWKFRFNLARGLGLMGDAQAIPDLIDGLRDAKSVSDAASLSQALGLIGDERAFEPLKAVLADRSRTGLQRGFCAVALGLIGEKTALPWYSAISTGLNYHARTAALTELLDLL